MAPKHKISDSPTGGQNPGPFPDRRGRHEAYLARLARSHGGVEPKVREAKMPPRKWAEPKSQFAILFEERFRIACEAQPAPDTKIQTLPLAFRATIDRQDRFRRSRDVGAHLGLTPARYQSSKTDIQGKISRCGDELARTALYEAAHTLLVRSQK